jgi:ribosomal protein L35
MPKVKTRSGKIKEFDYTKEGKLDAANARKRAKKTSPKAKPKKRMY